MNLDDFEGANLPARSEILSRKGIVVLFGGRDELRKVNVVLHKKLQGIAQLQMWTPSRDVGCTDKTSTASTCFIRYYRKKYHTILRAKKCLSCTICIISWRYR